MLSKFNSILAGMWWGDHFLTYIPLPSFPFTLASAQKSFNKIINNCSSLVQVINGMFVMQWVTWNSCNNLEIPWLCGERFVLPYFAFTHTCWTCSQIENTCGLLFIFYYSVSFLCRWLLCEQKIDFLRLQQT